MNEKTNERNDEDHDQCDLVKVESYFGPEVTDTDPSPQVLDPMPLIGRRREIRYGYKNCC
jgi:hypothetical protein